ncbi:MAG: dTDP-glucose 4,6-dehydratase [Candidatus Doudnabacteria bacterium CG10_big_fil_rev_8_21_14_0_10_41_10]|uniref:dTDP-glucose 4,6-dehydratase n=1 Tax=Candidatus Doudnabacteria bacterium CG10_big_fil_rev_8_21_14_0_10_41_10 TaxID=1974551 RepID=A0A2H0VE08_9BACT|nr:MAG: dTDP-glucose 4,6-dehydratase [Candidatus Doudnabacteria bacterium CG10_big_fil_rev_8_21_14_0_10_41_10]
MKNILVTGGAGFIGSNFIRYWLINHPEDKIVNLDVLTYAGNLENLKDIEKNPNYAFIKGDITDKETVDRAMKGIDTVVHFAAESHVDRSILEPEAFVRTNVLGTQVLLDAAREHNVKRFHHVSTDEVFGMIPLDREDRWTESSPYQPRSPYSASKAAADHLVRAYRVTYKVPVTISNCSNNIGPYQFPEKLVPLAITNLMEGKKVPIYGEGNQVREWLYVEDHNRAIDIILLKGSLGETYFIGPNHPEITNLRLVKKILKLMGKGEDMIEYVKDRPGHDQKYALDWGKIKGELEWEPENDLDASLQKTIDWYKVNEDWWRRVKSGKYREYYKKQYS